MKSYKLPILGVAMTIAGIAMTSCEDRPDAFKPTDGVPEVKYVRPTDPAKSDSLINGAFMGEIICLVGENLKSIHEIYFNDQKAVLNTSYLTDYTFIVAVPNEIPTDVTNKIYMVTADKRTVEYDFNVLVPAPQISGMSNEWACPGDEVTIYGDYMIDDSNVPLAITFPGNVRCGEITSVTKSAVTCIVPQGAETEGPVNVTSIYGTGKSTFHYRDTRGMLFDWDGTKGYASGHGWRNGVTTSDAEGIRPLDGNYLLFDVASMTPQDWPNEDSVSFNYWPEPSAGFGELSDEFDAEHWEDQILKFEVCVPASTPWTSVALNMIFTGNSDVTYASATNGYIGGDNARGLWYPWYGKGSYDTDGKWITVSMPLSNFTLNKTADVSSMPLTMNSFTGLTFIMYAGPQSIEDPTTIHIGIDNIRVVPKN